MSDVCSCCEREYDIIDVHPVLNLRACEGCCATIERVAGVRLHQPRAHLSNEFKQRIISAAKHIRTKQTQGNYHATVSRRDY